MDRRRMLLNSTEESFIGTMRIEYYNDEGKLYLDLNDNIEIIEEYFDDSENGYYIVGFKKDLIVPENFINSSNYCDSKFISEYNIIFDTRSVYAAYTEFHGNFTFNEQSITSIDIELFDYYYTFNYKCFNKFGSGGVIFFKGKSIHQYYKNDNWEIYANPHILYDLMKYNSIEEGDEKSQKYYTIDNNILTIFSPTEYIKSAPNIDLGDDNYIFNLDNYMYEGNYITEYICSSNITHLRKGITLPKDAIVYFPDTVIDIDSDTFKYESNLKKVIIFGNCRLTYLNGFDGTTLEDIEIYSDKITDIKAYCFMNSEKLTQFTTPKSVLKIGDSAFANTTLKSLYISKNVNSIGYHILRSSENIETIIVDENNQTYDSRNNCNAIIYNKELKQGCKNTIIPNDIDTIGSEAFSHMDLKEIIIPNNIINLKNNAFSYNPIDNIIIPENIIYIDTNCFNGTNIYKNENNWINGILYISNCIVSVKRNIGEEITILDNTRLICKNAFYASSSIIKINIPNSLKYINDNAFYEIGDLIIQYDGYENEWNDIIKSDGWNYNTNITYIFKTDIVEPEEPEPEEPEEEIPTFEGTPPNNQIWYTSTDEEIVEPEFLVSDVDTWDKLTITRNKYYPGKGGVIETDGDIVGFVEEEFYNKSNLKTITLPDSIIVMTTSPFGGCINLISIKIGKNYNGGDGYLSTTVLSNCSNLETIIIDSENPYCYDNNQTSIIRKKDNLLINGTKNAIIPNTVKQIGMSAFNAMGLTNITIHNNIEYIRDYAFAYNPNITTVVLPDTITLIGEGHFYDCTNLNNINIPINGQFTGLSIENTAIWNNEENWYNNGLYWDNALLYIRGTDGYDIYIVKSGTITICSYINNYVIDNDIKIPNSVKNILNYAFANSYVTELYYDGTVDEWNSINKSDLWNANSKITVIHCVDEDIQL